MKNQLRVHYIQHVPFEGLGCIGEWAARENHLLSATRFFKDEPLPHLSDIDWLIVMGGPMGIYDEELYSWLKEEKQFLKSAIAANKTILGICLGAQLLANALGAKVVPGKHEEIGWFQVRKTAYGKASGLLAGMPDELVVFHWHGDQFEIPAGNASLAESDICPNQIFQYKDHVLGLQFHFEATPDTIGQMLQNVADELKEGGPYIQSKETIESGMDHCMQSNQIMFTILDQLNRTA
jgi:GMP synthase (glutamine-hydrolysing)